MSAWKGSPSVSRSANGMGVTPVEIAALALAGVAVGVIALVWGAAAGSGRVAHRAWPELTFGDAARATGSLGANNMDFDAAWDPATRRQLGASAVFWAIFVAETVGVVGVVAGAARITAGRRSGRGKPDEISIQWATLRGVDKLLTAKPDGRRLTLGKLGNRYVATEERHSVVVFGPTQSGKTTSLVLPALLEWRGPVVATSAKSDILTLARPARQALGGRTQLFDPTRSTMLTEGDDAWHPGLVQNEPQSWSPLHAIESVTRRSAESVEAWRGRQWAAARESARWLVHAARTMGAGNQETEFWYVTAEKLLGPLLLAAVAEGATIGDVVRWINQHDKSTIEDALARAGVPEAAQDWEGCHDHEHRILSSSYTTLEVIMYAYGDPGVLSLAQTTDIKANEFLNGKPNTLFVVSPSHQQERLRPLFTALVSEIIHTAFDKATRSPTGRVHPPLLVILDEAANIAPLQNLDQIASMGAGMGVQLLTVFQDLGQVEQVYGTHRATTIANNHRARLMLPGVGDTATLRYMSELIGEQVLETTSISRDDAGNQSTTDNESLRPLAPTGWLRTLADDQAICIYGNLDPLRIDLRPWYRDKTLRAHAPVET